MSMTMTTIPSGVTAAAPTKTPAILERFKATTGFWYVGTVCTRYPQGTEAAHQFALSIRDQLTSHGLRCYVPVAYTRDMVKDAGLDIYDHDFWMAVNMPFMQRAHGMLVIASDGWDHSQGIGDEMTFFAAISRPTHLIFPVDLDR